jgi:hypothetical protein
MAREWLRSQGAAGYLRYDPATSAFTLPEAVAVAMLSRTRPPSASTPSSPAFRLSATVVTEVTAMIDPATQT